MAVAEKLGESWTVVPWSTSAFGRHLFKDVLEIFHPLYVPPDSPAVQQHLKELNISDPQSVVVRHHKGSKGHYYFQALDNELNAQLVFPRIRFVEELLAPDLSGSEPGRVTAGVMRHFPNPPLDPPHWGGFLRPDATTLSFLRAKRLNLPADIGLAAHFRGNDRPNNLGDFLAGLERFAEKIPSGHTLFWCSDVAESFEEARRLLEPRFELRRETRVPRLTPGEPNLHARTDRWYEARQINQVELIRDAIFDLFILVHAREVAFSEKTGWTALVRRLKGDIRAREALFGREET